MDPATLLADPAAIRLEEIVSDTSSLTLVVRTTRQQAECPRCHRPATRVHSYYTRKVADLPWHGVAVRLDLRTRRFRCKNSLRTKRVFCERLPRVVAHYGRKTVRLDDALRLIGWLLGGEAGARVTRKLAMAAGPDTLLRRVRAAVKPCARRLVPLASMTSPPGGGSATAPSSLTWSGIASSTSWQTARPPPSPPLPHFNFMTSQRGRPSSADCPRSSPAEVLEDLGSLLLVPQWVRLVGVAGGQQSRRRVGGLATLPVWRY